MKRCTKCGKYKKNNAFYKDKTKKNKLSTYCQVCSKVKERTKRKLQPHKTKLTDWQYFLKKNYDITPEEYNRMLKSQNGVCAICGEPEIQIDKRSNVKRRLAIDHDHKTGEIRGLLCIRCNVFVGRIDNNPTVLQSVIHYLGKHKR